MPAGHAQSAFVRWGPVALVVAVVAYGALLRIDAIAQTYAPPDRPVWLHALLQSRAGDSILRPRTVHWEPAPFFPHRDAPPSQYRSDPYTYLQRAREMPSFYGAHLREPLFPYVTKMFLALLDRQDVAVSFASALFSTLAIVATFLLGAEAFSFGVGLGAAALMAIEYDVITWSAGGWRDDAFTFSVAAVAWALLRCARAPGYGHAILAGVLAGGACLVRISSLSFLVPAFLYLLAAGGAGGQTPASRRNVVAVAVAVMSLTVAPYLINCWRVFGDPLYAINAHADVYRATEGQGPAPSSSAAGYLAAELRARPVTTLDTLLLGMTRYPFANKWTGFDPWVLSSGRWLSWAALAGLMLFACVPSGRLLLLVLAASLIPFAVTWRLIADWRFTEHAYPFFLIAACLAIRSVAGLLLPGRAAALARRRPSRRAAIGAAGCAVTVAAGVLIATRILPPLVFKEALRAGDAATIRAGDRDSVFFAEGWPEVRTQGAVTTRIAAESRPAVFVPLPGAVDYDAVVRMDSSALGILFNGRLIARCDPDSRPDRIGMCRFRIPAAAAREGMNRLTLAPDAAGLLRVWYVRLQRAPS